MNDTPTATAELAAAARTKVLVTDARGRVIAVHKLNLLDYYHLNQAMGERAGSPSLMNMAVVAASVRKIDVTDFAFPRTERDVEFILQLLDFDGLKAAGEGLIQLNPKADEDGTDAIKN
jgi:hypothetical protein